MGVAVVNPLSAPIYRQRGMVLCRFEPHSPFQISALRPLDRPRMEVAENFLSLLKHRCSLLALELANDGCSTWIYARNRHELRLQSSVARRKNAVNCQISFTIC